MFCLYYQGTMARTLKLVIYIIDNYEFRVLYVYVLVTQTPTMRRVDTLIG